MKLTPTTKRETKRKRRQRRAKEREAERVADESDRRQRAVNSYINWETKR